MSSAPADAVMPDARSRAQARALASIAWAEALTMVAAGLRVAFLRAADGGQSRAELTWLGVALSAATAVAMAARLGSLASWAASDGRILARVALGLALFGAVLNVLSPTLWPLLDGGPGLAASRVASYVAMATSWLTLLATLGSVASASGGPAARPAVWALFAAAAATRIAWMVVSQLPSPIGSSMSPGRVALTFGAPLLAIALALVVRAGPRPHRPSAAGVESWEVAMRGVAAVRRAELARVVVLGLAVALTALAIIGRSPALGVVIVLVVTVGTLGVALGSLAGLARARHIPFASDARGALRAAFALAAVTFVIRLFASGLVLWVSLRGASEGLDPQVIDGLGLDSAILGTAASVALLAGLRRAGRALGASAVSARATTAIVAYAVSLPALALAQTRHLAHASAPVIIAVLGVAVAGVVVGLVALLGSLQRLEQALRERGREGVAEPFL